MVQTWTAMQVVVRWLNETSKKLVGDIGKQTRNRKWPGKARQSWIYSASWRRATSRLLHSKMLWWVLKERNIVWHYMCTWSTNRGNGTPSLHNPVSQLQWESGQREGLHTRILCKLDSLETPEVTSMYNLRFTLWISMWMGHWDLQK